MSYLFCFGFGYSAQVLTHLLRGRGFRVAGTVRSLEYRKIPLRAEEELAALFPFDRHHPLNPALFAGVSHVLVSIPPDAAGDPVADMHGADLVQAAPVWVGYLSTTGVYGDTDGIWVDETAPINPSIGRSIARAAAERTWLTLWARNGLPVHLFRLASIYGRGRSPVDALRSGRAHRVMKPGHVSSRIHVQDLATALATSMVRPNPGAVYNICDDEPAPPQEVITYAAALLGWEPPPVLSWEEAQKVLPLGALTFYACNRRVRNSYIKRELELTLRYPTYREGLLRCV
ncbi:Nucleoside-diphosphate-sugar epimerases [invertebrate metagenome]|uniref:Nucleoside-diphosphate-sugar epimerases n=1 Tax=invertebrate metagenome TaxID=1711999 RepID=A0A484HAJ3_9ZZZZ